MIKEMERIENRTQFLERRENGIHELELALERLKADPELSFMLFVADKQNTKCVSALSRETAKDVLNAIWSFAHDVIPEIVEREGN